MGDDMNEAMLAVKAVSENLPQEYKKALKEIFGDLIGAYGGDALSGHFKKRRLERSIKTAEDVEKILIDRNVIVNSIN